MLDLCFGLTPRLQEVDWPAWERCFPSGIGASVFSSPGWQRLMGRLLGPEFQLKSLVGQAGSVRLTLPVYVRKWRYGRLELVTQPRTYSVLPMEAEGADASCIPSLMDAARAPLTLQFKWWLPPWLCGDRSLTTTDVDTYVIEVDGQVDHFLRRVVRKRYLESVRTSYRRGIEVVERPDAAQIEEYLALYHRSHDERSWDGDRYDVDFFLHVVHALGEGGKLVLFRHRDRVVGGGVVLFDRYAAHYFQGATDRETTDVKPHLVLYDWVIRAAAARGLRYVNLGGVNPGNESLADFKRSWGARPMAIPFVTWMLNRQSVAQRLGLQRFRKWATREIPSVSE